LQLRPQSFNRPAGLQSKRSDGFTKPVRQEIKRFFFIRPVAAEGSFMLRALELHGPEEPFGD
jgi:hypothetical protein